MLLNIFMWSLLMKTAINVIFILLIVTIINFTIMNCKINNSELKPFECGFESNYWNHPKLSTHFFKIGVIFILFDLELLMLILSFSKNLLLLWLIITFMFFSLWIELYWKGFSWNL